MLCVERGDVAAVRIPDDTSRVYYGTDTRLAELAMGAMLAMLMQRADRTADDRKQRDDGRGASAIILDVFGPAVVAGPMRRFLVHERL